MKKKIASLFLSTVCVISLAATAWGETSRGSSKWTVTFQEGNKMESNFGASDLDEVIYGMQPGDRAVLKLSLENKNSKASDWYMTNQILYSLEDRSGAEPIRISFPIQTIKAKRTLCSAAIQ